MAHRQMCPARAWVSNGPTAGQPPKRSSSQPARPGRLTRLWREVEPSLGARGRLAAQEPLPSL